MMANIMNWKPVTAEQHRDIILLRKEIRCFAFIIKMMGPCPFISMTDNLHQVILWKSRQLIGEKQLRKLRINFHRGQTEHAEQSIFQIRSQRSEHLHFGF